MRCPACEENTSSDFQFCTNCGSDLGAVTLVRPFPARPVFVSKPLNDVPRTNVETGGGWSFFGFLVGLISAILIYAILVSLGVLDMR